MNETWKPVVGHEGRYEVSDMGRVRSVTRTYLRGGCKKEQTVYGRILKTYIDPCGYPKLKVGERVPFVHLLVLEAFVGPRPEGMQACHNNGNPEDNRLSNLRWDTPKANVADRLKHGTYQFGSRNPSYKWSDEIVEYVRSSKEPAKEIERRLGMTDSHVYAIRSGKLRAKRAEGSV